MRIKDIEMGVEYAVKGGQSIEPATAVEVKRTNISHRPGIMMVFRHRKDKDPRWVAPQLIVETWTERGARLAQEIADQERWFATMVDLQDKLADALAAIGLDSHRVRLRPDNMHVVITDPDDVRLLLWEISGP